MNDTELLEAAARAAGMEDMIATTSDLSKWVWNPLANSGDALQLAVKLGMSVMMPDNVDPSVAAQCIDWDDDCIDGEEVYVRLFVADHNNDPMETTRRAIVMAAAEIEKKLHGESTTQTI